MDTANYIHNRFPHQSIENKIPYEVFFNKPVNYNNLRVFGCRVYFFVPKELRSKFDNNSHPGIFLGYCENPSTYKILDIINNRIIPSRTVEFFEKEPGNSFFNRIHSNNEFRKSNYTNHFKSSNDIYNHNNNTLNDENITTIINQNKRTKNQPKDGNSKTNKFNNTHYSNNRNNNEKINLNNNNINYNNENNNKN